jgi:hypothetical protein
MNAQSCHKRNQVKTRHKTKQSLTETNSHNDKIRSQHHKVNKTQPKRRRNDSNCILRQRHKFPTTTDKIQRTRRKSTNNNNENETTAKQNNHQDKNRDQLGEKSQSEHKWSTSQDGRQGTKKKEEQFFESSTKQKNFLHHKNCITEKKEPMRNVQ